MRIRLIAASLLALLSSHASAFDAAQVSRYPSPDLGRPHVGQLTTHGPIICAPGASCDASSMGVTPSDGTFSRTLQQIITDVRSAEFFNAKGDGTTDDTQAFKDISTWLGAAPGRGVVGRTGATYLVTNWVWPYQQGNSFSCPEQCTIKAKAGGDADYLVSTYRYVNNIPYMDYPIRVRNVVFDGAGIKNKVFVAQTYFSQFQDCYAINSAQDGWVLPGTTKNGTAFAQVPGPENTWRNGGAYGNARHGLYNTIYTDGQIRGGQWYDNGGPSGTAGYNLYVDQTAGWGIQGIHTYGKGTQLNHDAYFGQVGYGSVIANNLFEGIVTLASVENLGGQGTIGPNNNFWGGLEASIGNSGSTVLTSFGNIYKFASGQIRHQFNFADHIVRSVNDTFDTATPFAWSAGNTTGVIRSEGSFSKGLGGKIEGEYTSDSIVLPSDFKLTKSLANATSTTITATVVVRKDVSQAPFQLTVDLQGSVSSASYSVLDAFSAQVVTVGAREYQSATSNYAAKVASSASTNGAVTFTAAAVAAGGTGDQTVTVTITINHPTPSFTPTFPLSVRATVKGKSVKSVTLN